MAHLRVAGYEDASTSDWLEILGSQYHERHDPSTKEANFIRLRI